MYSWIDHTEDIEKKGIIVAVTWKFCLDSTCYRIIFIAEGWKILILLLIVVLHVKLRIQFCRFKTCHHDSIMNVNIACFNLEIKLHVYSSQIFNFHSSILYI